MNQSKISKQEYDRGVGDILRQARIKHGLSLEDVSIALRIPSHQLKSLEKCELETFDAEVYARGAFEKYATYLGVSPTTNQAFSRMLSQGREAVPLKLLTPRSWLAHILTPRWIFLMVGSAIALSVGSYIIWQVQTFLRLPALALVEPAQEVLNTREIMVKGKSETNATVTVNNQPVLLQSDGSFEMPLTIQPGINVLRVEARNAAERSRIIQKDLLLPRT